MKKHVKYALFVLAFLLLVVLAWFVGRTIVKAQYQAEYFVNLPVYSEDVPKTKTACTLCQIGPINPPCLIDLNTGKIGEIRLYDPDPINPAEVNTSVEEYGVAQHFGAAGASCYSFPDNHYTSIGIQRERLYKYSAKHARQYFCDNCMAMIQEVEPNCNYLFADCYDKENVALFKIEDAKREIQIRHYTVKIEEMNDKYLYLDMESSFFD